MNNRFFKLLLFLSASLLVFILFNLQKQQALYNPLDTSWFNENTQTKPTTIKRWGSFQSPNYTGYDKIIHVVSHSHWDREWYMGYETFRKRLVWMLDDIFRQMDENPQTFNHFFLDGQSQIIDDYLEIRPEKRELVLEAIRENKLSFGPLTTLPDEFLSSGEALIRNFLHSYQNAKKLGVNHFPVAYLGDTFGHVSQLPQIILQFGMNVTLYTRGTMLSNKIFEHWWEAPGLYFNFSYHFLND
jgi:hypothetical protein